jgi:hypothetical protein
MCETYFDEFDRQHNLLTAISLKFQERIEHIARVWDGVNYPDTVAEDRHLQLAALG